MTPTNSSKSERVWMVAGIEPERGWGTPTWGPFKTREEAQRFADFEPNRYVYDAVQNRKSLCGPWLP